MTINLLLFVCAYKRINSPMSISPHLYMCRLFDPGRTVNTYIPINAH